MRISAVLVLVVAALGCQRADTSKGGGSGASGSGTSSTSASGGSFDIDSKDILDRKDTFPEVDVKHVLLSWKDLSSVYGGRQDPKGAARSQADAAKLAQDILAQLKAKPERIDELVAQYGEDPGMKRGKPYTVKSDTPFVPEFKQLALRLKPNEAGIVKTNYGYHVIERVPPPPPDPLESNDILSRQPETGTVWVQHVLIGWKDIGRGDRSKDDADKLAVEILGKVRAGDDMAALMKQYSEDPGSKDTGKPYDVSPDSPMVPPFKNLSLRLKEGEAGMVKSDFGWHVIKRVPPPPPDPLESVDILKREPVTQKAKVKHILLGWKDKDVRSRDPRGQKRERPELEKLVKSTVAKLKGGAKIEPLMKELSEDPGSAASGEGYDVTPDAGLVPPFKNLSLRLNVGEVGVVRTEYGIHIIQRVE